MERDVLQPDGSANKSAQTSDTDVAVVAANWTSPGLHSDRLVAFGFRLAGGGVHQSKTMMFQEIEQLLGTGARLGRDLKRNVVEDNVLGKKTGNTRVLTWRHLASLYGLSAQPAITKALLGLWATDIPGRRLSALLVALSRDPLLRDTVDEVVSASVGVQVYRSKVEHAIHVRYPGRLSDKMVRSLAQNCNSTWTQSGHLAGSVRKLRQRVTPTPANAAFAALIATVCGFGGPSVLSSMWMRVLDLTPEQALDHLRRAEALGLARVRSAGDVTEIAVRQPMATVLGVRELEHV
jgi:hypothetical protein